MKPAYRDLDSLKGQGSTMISLELWRARIGLSMCTSSSLLISIIISLWLMVRSWRWWWCWVFSSLCRSLLIRRAFALLLVVVITHLLLSAGDVNRTQDRKTARWILESQWKSNVTDSVDCISVCRVVRPKHRTGKKRSAKFRKNQNAGNNWVERANRV